LYADSRVKDGFSVLTMEKLAFQSLRGTRDILPEESFLWQELEKKAREIFSRYNYKEIRTPILEDLALFVRSVGKTTDIVQKEMYSFLDKGKREICLRPEATASCVRAYLEHNLALNEPFSKFYYLGPMFRAERPQEGRLREFHQLGVEVMGSDNYLLDAEVISLMVNLVKEFGLSEFSLKINSLGCVKDKEAIAQKYKKLLEKKKHSLCETCGQRLQRNVLRVLDCKEATCQKAIQELPPTIELICPQCRSHFEQLLKVLDTTKIVYKIDTRIVRGIDYYTRTVFELTSSALGSQDALGAGGRYDNLIESFTGPSLGAVGFALGLERIILALEKSQAIKQDEEPLGIFVITLGEEAGREGFILLEELREKGLSGDMDYTDRSLRAKMRYADKLKARFVLIIGEEELKKGEYILREMATSQQTSVPKKNAVKEIMQRLNPKFALGIEKFYK
jgi:histidyl-tRNA synthetase